VQSGDVLRHPRSERRVDGRSEQIAKLAMLRDQGVLTEDEFAIKKAELLARL